MPTVVQLTETTTTLKLKVAAPPPTPPDNINSCTNPKFSNWDFLQSIPKKTSEEKQSTLYTHPLAKNSSFSKLSPKSLQLCTENLGSETGSENIAFPCSNSSIPSSNPIENSSTHLKSEFENSNPNQKGKSPNYCRKINNFPPPLTTMSRSSSLQVRRHTEEGRLIIEAVDAPFRNSYLQAERSDGRLKLCFLTGGGEEEEEEEEEDGGGECGGEVDEIDENDEIEEARSELDEFEGERDNEMAMEKFQRMTIRCNEHEGLCNYWKPPALWVATS